MLTVPIRGSGFFTISSHRMKSYYAPRTVYCSSWKMTILDSKSTQKSSKVDTSEKVVQKLAIPQFETTGPSDLHCNQLQKLDKEFIQEDRIEFGQFVAREAVLDEEYWTAAWLRAESHWEDQINEKYVDNYKRKFAEQEFHALKRRSKTEPNSSCIVTVKEADRNVKRTFVKTVVGTLDVSIRYLLPGETFPGESVKSPLICSINRTERNKYGYIANLCVSKSARRQGIAANMLFFAVNSAKANGAEQVFVHVYRNNRAAQDLYQKMGFEVVEMANSQLSKEQTYLLSYAL